MDGFDLGRLTDHDFEEVCKDLFEDVLGVDLELFAPGRDGGVDLRHFSGFDKLVVQCKHWWRSGWPKLLSYIRRVEVAKVVSLSPSRYVLATTVPLTPANKDELMAALAPYVRKPGDIYGLHEIVAMLRDRPHIVERHLKLWLSSTTVLKAVLNRDIAARSQALSEDLDETMRVFVSSASSARAEEILAREHVCVIAGQPGIGKSTLARMLVAKLVAQGYQLVDATWDFGDIDRMWHDDAEQVFYMDDFLGQTSLDEHRGAKAGISLPALLRRVGRSDNKRIVLTTREYILAQAREKFDRLDSHTFSPLTCTVNLADYTIRTRADILYNHVYHSDLPEAEKALFANGYERVIHHTNYSPRIVQHVLRMRSARDGHAHALDAVVAHLDRPKRIWEHLVENVLNDAEVALVVVLFSFDRRVAITELEQAWSSYRQQPTPNDGRMFKRALKTLNGTMIRIYPVHNEHVAEFANPSVADYLTDFLSQDLAALRTLLTTLHSFEQLRQLWNKANTYRQKALYDALSKLKPQFADAAAGFSALTAEANESIAEVLSTMLSVAEFCDSDVLAALVAHRLETVDLYYDSKAGYDMTGLVVQVNESKFEVVVQHGHDLLADAVELVTLDISDWDSMLEAERLAHQLSDLASGLLEEIQSTMSERLADELDAWENAGPDEPVGYYLSRLLDWASTASVDVPDSFFVACEARDDAEDEHEAPAPDDTLQRHRTELGKVHQMFATLRPDDVEAD